MQVAFLRPFRIRNANDSSGSQRGKTPQNNIATDQGKKDSKKGPKENTIRKDSSYGSVNF